MYSDTLLSEIERQKKYLDLLPQDFTFPLFNAKYAIESQRRSGYRTTASAAREIVDNSIEAGADWVHVVFDSVRNNKRVVSAIAFIDNGSGMLPTMARYALSWGGGTHFDDPNFIGKFGFGLPNASINQARCVEVYTRTREDEEFTKAWLDIDEYSHDFGVQAIPDPVTSKLPEFVERYLHSNKLKLDHGTVVVWRKPDRLSYKSPGQLKEHLLDDFGVTYRYLLSSTERPINLVVEGVEVATVDPLFLMPSARYYMEPVPDGARDEGGARLMDDRSLVLKYYEDPEIGERHLKKIDNTSELSDDDPNLLALGTIYIKIARFPIGFVQAIKKAGDAYRRFEFRKSRRGMTFVRAGREIETVDVFPKSIQDTSSGLGVWPLLQSYAYHWGVEVKFEPVLDEVFGITNDKQSVRPIEDFWRILHEESIDAALMRENNWQVKERKELKKLLEKQVSASEEPSPAELAAQHADVATTNKPAVPDFKKQDARSKLDDTAKERVETKQETIEEARAAIQKEQQRRPYKIDFMEKEYGPFYLPEWIGSQIVIKINKAHPFFDMVYGSLVDMENGKQAKEAVDLLLITLGRAELSARDEEFALWYETQREQVWSPYLKAAMKDLQSLLSDSAEEELQEV